MLVSDGNGQSVLTDKFSVFAEQTAETARRLSSQFETVFSPVGKNMSDSVLRQKLHQVKHIVNIFKFKNPALIVF